MKITLRLLLLLSLASGAACGRRESAPDEDIPPLPPGAAEPVDLPDDLDIPPDLPPCPGLLAVEETAGDRRNGSMRLASSQRASALAEFYAEHLSANGWVMAASFRQGKEEHLQFRQGVRFLRLQIAPAPGRGNTGSHIRMAWGLPDGEPLTMESQAPDYEEEMSEAEPPSHEW